MGIDFFEVEMTVINPGLSTIEVKLAFGREYRYGVKPSVFYNLDRISSISPIGTSSDNVDVSAVEDCATKYSSGRTDTGGEWNFKFNVNDETIAQMDNMISVYKSAKAADDRIWFEVYSPYMDTAFFVVAEPQTKLPTPETGQNEAWVMDLNLVIQEFIGTDTAVNGKSGNIIRVYNGVNTDTGASNIVLYNNYESVSLAANEAETGKKFAYWTADDGTIIGYESAQDVFVINGYTSVTANYVDEDTTVDAVGLVVLSDISVNTLLGRRHIYATILPTLPSNCTGTEVGFIITSDSTLGDDLNVDNADDSIGEEYDPDHVIGGSVLASNGMNYIRGYLTYTDENNNEVTVYGDVIEVEA